MAAVSFTQRYYSTHTTCFTSFFQKISPTIFESQAATNTNWRPCLTFLINFLIFSALTSSPSPHSFSKRRDYPESWLSFRVIPQFLPLLFLVLTPWQEICKILGLFLLIVSSKFVIFAILAQNVTFFSESLIASLITFYSWRKSKAGSFLTISFSELLFPTNYLF